MIVWVLFVIWYTIRADWWKSQFGWNTMVVSSLVVLALAVPLLPAWIAWSLTAAGVHRLVLLEMTQRRHKNLHVEPIVVAAEDVPGLAVIDPITKEYV